MHRDTDPTIDVNSPSQQGTEGRVAASWAVWSPHGAAAPEGAPAVAASAPGVAEAATGSGPGVPVEDVPQPVGSVSRAERDSGVMPGIRHRQYLKIRRRNRCHPVFSDEEWADVQAAASASGLKPGGYAAAVTVAAARSDNPEAAVADIRRLLEELMEADRQAAAIGNNLNQIAHNLWVGGTPPPHLQHVFDRVVQTLEGIDTAAASIIGR
ncbi:hypothetical protein ATKI12_1617 [Kitasatospora sp. Ki12]